MDMKFKGKCTKKDFEDKVIAECTKSDQNVTYRPYDEHNYETNLSTRLYLYYIDGKHVGTWTKGEGWIFDWSKN